MKGSFMFYKTVSLSHITIKIKTDDVLLYRMLDQYPLCRQVMFEVPQINITAIRKSPIPQKLEGYHEIPHHFNVGSDISIHQFCQKSADIIMRISANSELCINRNFACRFINCYYDGDISDCRNFICAVVETFVTNILYTLNFLPIHGAVVMKDNICVALCGASGSGKSTTLLQLLEQGGNLLANDLFYLDCQTLEAYSLDKTFGVRKTNFYPVKQYCEKISRMAPYIYSTDQNYYDMQLFLKNQFITTAKLDALFIMNIGNGKSLTINKGLHVIKQFLSSCIFPSPCIQYSVNFMKYYDAINSKCLIGQIILPDLKKLPSSYSDYVITWKTIQDYFQKEKSVVYAKKSR